MGGSGEDEPAGGGGADVVGGEASWPLLPCLLPAHAHADTVFLYFPPQPIM